MKTIADIVKGIEQIHADRISEVERNAEDRMDRLSLGFSERFQRIDARLGKLAEENAREIEQINQRLQGATTIAELLDRIHKLESQTYEQQKVLNRFFPTREPIPEKGEATGFKSCMVLAKNETLINAGKRAKSLGWINVYPDNNVVMLPDQASANEQYRRACAANLATTRLACFEVFEGDDKPKRRGSRSMGWVNVYKNSVVSLLHFSRGTADDAASRSGNSMRAACVEIFEGDGL